MPRIRLAEGARFFCQLLGEGQYVTTEDIETGLSQSSVSRTWRAFGRNPHLVETWKLSTDPEFIAKGPPRRWPVHEAAEHALVLAVDGKSQALVTGPPCLPILPTTPARITHDYVPNGITGLFAAYDVGSGSVIAQSYRRHRHQEFLRLLKLLRELTLNPGKRYQPTGRPSGWPKKTPRALHRFAVSSMSCDITWSG